MAKLKPKEWMAFQQAAKYLYDLADGEEITEAPHSGSQASQGSRTGQAMATGPRCGTDG